ncbi:hypothetical protein NIES4072_18520 [Nostoc commune NIES-4072]|uniref:Uncharacterized protein n=2 Tax=Nostoc commune TaxID=1178 RepID=A0A2R5FL65_NOSCO|nr:hypothetical protein [Nostoc commune]BBD64486.1 hypothetical protein NIES4070_08290 [Nostoc commune HK-02]GBG18188.1 hypothetical protein NIES4072_18520 [Nostoc commune NIES-4072]
MGTTKDEKTTSRREEAEVKPLDIARRNGITGREGQNLRNQQERDHRASSQKSSIFSSGTAVTGGMLDHLIDEYCSQVAIKQEEIERLNNEVSRLETRVQEFKALRAELQKQFQEAS